MIDRSVSNSSAIFNISLLILLILGGVLYTVGGVIYALKKDKFKIVSLCDIKERMLEIAKERFGVKDENCFTDSEEYSKIR